MLKGSVILCALAVAVAGSVAEAPKIETKHLTAVASATPDAAAPGKHVSLALDVTPKPKMHVYSPGQEGYITVALTLTADPSFTAGKAKYPAGEKVYIELLKETQVVYAKPFRISQDITLRDGAKGPVTVKGTLRYQACDDTICYLPTTVPVSWTLKADQAR